MRVGLLLLSLCLAYPIMGLQEADAGELKFAAAFVRHGARSPLGPVQGLSADWPNGFGQLTSIGERQLYLLGHSFREYFVEKEHLMGKTYNSSELYVRSTATTRTMMSGQSLLLGMYPDMLERLNEPQLRDEALWTPPYPLGIPDDVKRELGNSSLPFNTPVVPILSYAVMYEKLLAFESCPKYYGYWDPYFTSKRFKDLYAKYNDSFTLVANFLGIDISHLKNDDIYYVLDAIVTLEFHEKLQKAEPLYPKIRDLQIFFTRIMVDIVSTDEWMIALGMHEFSREVPALFEAAISGTSKPKLALYMTHDMVLMAYLLGLGVKPESTIFDDIPFASHLMLELWKTATGNLVSVTFNGKKVLTQEVGEFKKAVEAAGKLKKSWAEECVLPKNVGDIDAELPSQTRVTLADA